jgi:hypothetical protein
LLRFRGVFVAFAALSQHFRNAIVLFSQCDCSTFAALLWRDCSANAALFAAISQRFRSDPSETSLLNRRAFIVQSQRIYCTVKALSQGICSEFEEHSQRFLSAFVAHSQCIRSEFASAAYSHRIRNAFASNLHSQRIFSASTALPQHFRSSFEAHS